MLKRIILSSIIVLSATANASAPVKTVTIDHMPNKADVSRFTRKKYKGARPKIEKVNDLEFKVRFVYKNELRRLILKYTLSK